MVVSHFLKWAAVARVAERAAAASALARAYVSSNLTFEDHCAAEAALTLLLDDPSAKVRHAMAEALSMSRHAPVQIIAALAADQPEIAAMVIGRSPLLTDADLIDRVASGRKETQSLIAGRAQVSMSLAAAIAEIGEPESCMALLANSGADIAALSFHRIAERHGHLAGVREALIADMRLPADCRHLLLVKVSEALQGAPLLVALMGRVGAERVVHNACVKASITLLDNTPTEEHEALVGHLRLRGELTTGFIVRAVAHGKVDFFGTALVMLAGQSERRVRALLSSGYGGALRALLRRAGLPDAAHAPLLRAIRIWRDVANGRRIAGVQEVSWAMLEGLGDQPAEKELAGLIRAIHVEALRDNARRHALALAAA